MGFFDTIKKNLNHGGIKVHLEAVNHIRLSDIDLPVQVVIVSTSDQLVQINGLSVRLYYDEVSKDNTSHMQNDVINIQAPEASFSLQPAETRTFDMRLPLNAEKVAQAAGANAAISLIAKAVDVGSSLSQMMNDANRTYYLTASADVEGISLDPSDTKMMQVLNPNEIGNGSFKIGF